MKYYAPDYYSKFKCIAGKCRHNCCIGWEIDIDEDTLSLYDTVGGETGERLRGNIHRGDGCAHFVLGENGRCPFLNRENLCDLIIELGDGALCDICADHPRFRNCYADRIEEGLGLSCEEAARLILTNEDRVQLVLSEDDGENEPADEEELRFILLRNKIIEMLQTREVPVDMRLTGVLAALGAELPDMNWEEIKQHYLVLERLEPDWGEYLNKLTCESAGISKGLGNAYEQLLVYLVYRNLKKEDITGSMKFCALSYLVIRRICDALGGMMGSLLEVSRRYSSEIEYSDENVQKLIEML